MLAVAASVSILLAAITADPATPRNPEPTAQQPDAQPTTRLVRSTSGTRGRQDGNRYVVEDPRSAFDPAADRQIVVLFDWEAPAGTHHCEARWKDPSGAVVLTSPVDHRATSRRFSIYWSIALPETAAKGLWAVETFVDGAPAGTHVFEIAGSFEAVPRRRSASQRELYQKASASVASVERLGPAGELLGRGPAVALDGSHLITAFPSIEGASALRLRTATGAFVSKDVGEWDRKSGWAVLTFPQHGLVALARSGKTLEVGDACFVLDSSEDESQVISEAAVAGKERPPASRPRLNSGFAAGSPVLDEAGDLAGIIVASSAAEQLGAVAWSLGFSGPAPAPRDSIVVLANRLPAAPSARIALAELDARGEFMRALSPEQRHVVSGVFAAKVQRGGAVPMPQEQKVVFSRREGQLAVFVQWNPQAKKDAESRIDVYNSEYRLIVKGVPTKVKLRPGTLFFTTWTLGIDQLPADVYRTELLLDGAPIWRGYVRVTE